ncbi:MAG TPA: hypothetical protein VE987_21955 [Polyangiaceae bacterium]|nr:hypothetical protein [Polyangiaceae bacterium]
MPTLPCPANRPSAKRPDHAARYQRIRAAIVAEWRPRIEALVAGLPEAQRAEAAQVALIGVLVALERWEPGRSFEPAAWMQIAEELRLWSRATKAWRHRVTGQLFSDAEARDRLAAFLKTLTPADRALLLCAKRERAEGARARRYSSLVARARAFVEGAA